MPIIKKGSTIRSLAEWETLAGPKRAYQWKDGRSAKEAARAWLGVTSPALPEEIAAALATNAAFDLPSEWTAEPEVRIPFDDLRGEPRNTDLLVRARDARGTFLIAVEGKADEAFGETVDQALAAARRRLEQNPRSGGVERIRRLVASLFGTTVENEPAVGRLRYQLLTATAGALAAARREGGVRVMLLIQEFRSSETRDDRCRANAADLDSFAARLTRGELPTVAPGQVFGPYVIDAEVDTPPLFIGKVTRGAM